MKHRKPNKLNESPSHLNRRLKGLKIPAYNADIDQIISLAEEKIAPILKILVDNPNGAAHYIHVKDCSRIEEFQEIIRDLIIALRSVGFQVNIQLRNLDLDNYKEHANSKGLIYVDTILLLNIMELYNTLQNIKEELDAFYRSIGIHSFVQTESGLLSLASVESANPNKIVFKLRKSPTKGSSRFGLLSSDFFVMPSSTSASAPLSASKSEVVEGSFAEDLSALRRIQSASSVEDQFGHGVNDVYRARKILVRCIGDLQDVSDYLGMPRKDAATICSLMEVENAGTFSETDHSRNTADNTNSKGNCCCKECFADSADGVRPECEDDQVIVCIKGCNEEEGDVQIVIRQCPDCKKGNKNEMAQKVKGTNQLTNTKSVAMRPSFSVGTSYSDVRTGPKEIESTILHNKDSRGSIVCSDEEDEQRDVDCSRINMFETTNLCLKTDTGQELIISLTVTPRELGAGKLSLRDIFSEDLEKQSSSTQPINYYVADRYIPLGRTKVCSSLEFDVGTADSKLRRQGIKHKDNKIVVQLENLGTDNLLRACRPAKCCRKAILNERMKKCLPYAPSIRSLPLDDEDMRVIKESLEMSLQKVKNSIDIKKDLYRNKIRTVMYFIVEEDISKEQIEFIWKKNFIRKKLNYYINLVNDSPVEIKISYIVLYFGVENEIEKVVKNTHLRNNTPNREDEIPNNRVLNINIADIQSIPINYLRSYDETPLPSHQNFFYDRRSSYLQNLQKPEVLRHVPESSVYKKKTFVSKIPVYQGKKKVDLGTEAAAAKTSWPRDLIYKPSLDSLPSQNVLEKMSEDFGFSKSSLKVNDTSTSNNYPQTKIIRTDYRLGLRKKDLRGNVCSQIVNKKPKLFSESFLEFINNIPKEEKNATNLSKQLQNKFSPQSSTGDSLKNHVSSKCSLSSSNSRNKRKKKEFYLARSKSEISMTSLKRFTSKPKKCKPLVKPLAKDTLQIQSEKRSKKANEDASSCTNKSKASKILQDEEYVSRVVLNYFSKALYKMILEKVMKGKLEKELSRKALNVGVGTDSTSIDSRSLHEIYRRTVNDLSRHKNTKISHHELKAKQSQICIAVPFLTNRNHPSSLCVFNNLSLQTSIIFGDTKTCQTSDTLLAYLFHSTNWQTDNFLKTYQRNCQQDVHYLVNEFKSEDSLSSTVSGPGLISPYLSGFVTESEDPDSLDQSLIQLKDTLEKYENVKHQIAQNNETVNPIDYFVYQMCACNGKLNKKPSMMQKLFGKTKMLFSSVEKDLCKKFENQRKFFNMSSQDRADLCYSCGCFISKCGDGRAALNTDNILCMCPDEYKTKKIGISPYCCKEKTKTVAKKLSSKLQSASVSSLKTMQSCFKRSMDELISHGIKVKKSLAKVRNNKTTQKDSGNITICYDPTMKTVVCEKKSAATSTTKDNGTQKCACGKCDSLLEDGTCCCSHCLGCLDKSFNTNVDDEENIAVAANGSTQTNEDPNKNNKSTGNNQPNVSNVGTDHKQDSQVNTDQMSNNKSIDKSLKGSKDKPTSAINKKESKFGKKHTSIVNSVSITNSNHMSSDTKAHNESSNTKDPITNDEGYLTKEESVVEEINPKVGTSFNAPLATSTPNNSQENIISTPENQAPDETEDDIPESPNVGNNNTTYFVLTPTPQMFQSLGFGSGNPFESFALGFPPASLFHINQPDNGFNR
ncbi:uncharacterized protein LOC126737334 [Anthonomus grandis grandis]|uniref:uncharacterized protein LOC126737334 n=1 Tax=Anthonomus grandis grandis TaxID=2921223 RepID=UPI002165A4FA|nr:uncharacterized protein LOC126737334 [Anthonomus grandis grandis]